MKNPEIVDLLCNEKDNLRVEVIEMQKSLHKALLGFITIGVAFSGILFQNPFSTDGKTLGFIIICLSQIEFAIALFCASVLTNVFVHSGYLAALDEEINKQVGLNISLWESNIHKHFLYSPKGVFFYCSAVVGIYYVLLFGTLIFYSVSYVASNIFFYLNLIEVGIILLLFGFSFNQRSKVKNHAKKVLGSPLEKEDKKERDKKKSKKKNTK